jgi:transposase-like protein
MTIIELHEMFGTDDRCREILERLRWPQGPICPRCKHQGHSWLDKYDRYECNACQHQFTVISGTVFQDTHLALTKWFVATYLLCESRKGMSANQIKRIIGGSYKTAWYLCHRIRAAMKEVDRPMMDGTVEVDETYVGGRPPRGSKPGRGTPKEVVIGIRQRGGDLRFFHASDAQSGTLAKYIGENVSQDVEVMVTDEFTSYPGAMKKTGLTAKHKTIKHKNGVYVDGDIHTNTVESAFSLLKRGIIGTWHKISAKHLQAYLDEMTFRFDRRKNSDLFIDTLRHMITAPVLTFEKLTA